MFRVEFAPDAARQLEHLILQQLEDGGKSGAHIILENFENCVAVFREDPVSGGVHVNGIPRRYRAAEMLPGIYLIYQIDEDAGCVRVDGVVENQAEISD